MFIIKLLGLVGLVHVLRWLYTYVHGLFFTKKVDLAARYGKNSWVVVTGANDGIGLSYCKALAKDGFNIVLVARRLERLEAASQEVKNVNPLVETKVVVADFSNSDQPGFFDDIANKLKDLDISILINNAAACEKVWKEDSSQAIKDVITTNVNGYLGMTRILVPQMQTRKQRAAIINITSVAALIPLPLFPFYEATKSLIVKFTEEQAMHLPSTNVDVLNAQPALVATKLSGKAAGDKMSIDIAQTPEAHVEGALEALGNTSHTFGAFYHRAVYGVVRQISRLAPADLVWYLGVAGAKTA